MSVFVDIKRALVSQNNETYLFKDNKLQNSDCKRPQKHFTLFGQLMHGSQIYLLLTSAQHYESVPTRVKDIVLLPQNKELLQALSYIKHLLFMVDDSPYERFGDELVPLVIEPTVYGYFKEYKTFEIQAVIKSPLLTRFERGIVDKVPANSAEITLICNKVRYEINKGSVPIKFKQPLAWKYTPDLYFLERDSEIMLDEKELPISLLNNKNEDEVKLNENYCKLCNRVVKFDMSKQSQQQTQQFCAEIIQQMPEKIPRINCLDCVDRTTGLICELFQQITGKKNARIAAYIMGAHLGRDYVGTIPQRMIQDCFGVETQLDNLINGVLGVLRYFRGRITQPVQEYYYDMLNGSTHFVCYNPFRRLAIAYGLAALALLLLGMLSRKLFVTIGIFIVMIFM